MWWRLQTLWRALPLEWEVLSVQELAEVSPKQYPFENEQKVQKQRDRIIQRLKEEGCRITKQRMVLLDVILEEDCSCCKEIYYKAVKLDSGIGTATVYRMLHTLEKIGIISRKNMFRIVCWEETEAE